MKTTPATSYNDRISLNRSLHEVFQKVKEQSLKLDMDFDAGRILSQLDKEYSSILRRQELVSLNWFKRKTRAFDMLFKGEYKNFNGIHSFIRDILR